MRVEGDISLSLVLPQFLQHCGAPSQQLKGSALESFLFRTALKNDFDFHPGSVTRYLRDAYLSPLLTRLRSLAQY